MPLELLERMLQLTSEFYKKPVEEKLKYARTPAKDGKPPSDGYGSLYFSGQATLDWKDYFVHYCVPRSRHNPERWPAEPETTGTIMTALSKVYVLFTESKTSVGSLSCSTRHFRVSQRLISNSLPKEA